MTLRGKIKSVLSYCCVFIFSITLGCLLTGCSIEDKDSYLSATEEESYVQRNMFVEIPHTNKSLIWDRQSTCLVYDRETYTVYYLTHIYYSYIPVPYYINGHTAIYDPETGTINPAS